MTNKLEELLLDVWHKAMIFVIAFNKAGQTLSYFHPEKTQQKYEELTNALMLAYVYMGTTDAAKEERVANTFYCAAIDRNIFFCIETGEDKCNGAKTCKIRHDKERHYGER